MPQNRRVSNANLASMTLFEGILLCPVGLTEASLKTVEHQI